jgi:hypothetical protein
MNESFEQLEREIDAGLAAMGDKLDAAPPGAVGERARMAVHLALNEAVLAESSVFVPSDKAVQRVREQVRAELGVESRRWFPATPAAGAWSAAAMIAACFGLIYYSGTIQPGMTTGEDAVEDVVIERFIAVNEPLMSEPALTSSISSEMDSLEESISNWQPAWSDLDQLIEPLDTETGDQSRTTDESTNRIASNNVEQKRVVG